MTEFLALVPWIVVLVVFICLTGLAWRLTNVIGELARLLSPASVPALSPVITLPKSAVTEVVHTPVAAAPAAPALPKPQAASAGAPSWYSAATAEIGFHETGNNQGIERYIALAHCGAAGDPWCAIFANAMLESAGIAGTRSAASQSFRSHPGFVPLTGPALGAIVVFWRGSKDSGLGHVGFYAGEDAAHIWTLGGNENDAVRIEALPKDSATFGLVGYFWPKSAALPVIGPLAPPSGQVATPALQAPVANASVAMGTQHNITATMFGSQQSAYGGAIDDHSPGVALPFHFVGDRPRVRVTSCANGLSIDCAIVDVGPWNTNDPYWTTGARPQAESGTDSRGRRSNGAGIDLTLAAAMAIKLDGKGRVEWEFVQSPLAPGATHPNVT